MVQTPLPAFHRHVALSQLLLLLRAWRKRPGQPCAAVHDQKVAHAGCKFRFAVTFPITVCTATVGLSAGVAAVL